MTNEFMLWAWLVAQGLSNTDAQAIIDTTAWPRDDVYVSVDE